MMFRPFWDTAIVSVFDPLTVIDPERSSPVLASTVTARVPLPVPEVFSMRIQLAEGVAVQSFSVVTYTSLVEASSASNSSEVGFTVRVSWTSGLFFVGSQEKRTSSAAREARMEMSVRFIRQFVMFGIPGQAGNDGYLAGRGPVRGPGPKNYLVRVSVPLFRSSLAV